MTQAGECWARGRRAVAGTLGPGVATAGSSQPCRCGGLRAAELHGEQELG